MTMSDKHEILLRMRAVELLAYWEGRVVTNRLMSWFGISRQQAGHDIKRYIAEHNTESLIYSPSSKGYIPSNNFKPVLTRGHINEYLDMISSTEAELSSINVESTEHLAAVKISDRSVKPEVLRGVLMACRTSQNLEITYSSMNNPVPHQRIISPHILIYSGFRWHVRAYCHSRHNFRDFILSRIQNPVSVSGEFISNEADALWHESVTLSLVANPNLSVDQRRLVELDFCMIEGKLTFEVRKAMTHYALQRYQAGITTSEQQEALKYPIVVSEASKDVLRGILFGDIMTLEDSQANPRRNSL